MANKLYASARLKELREKSGMTQGEFVGIMTVWLDEPISLSMLQSIEQGRRPVKPELVLEIARYFKVEPKELAVRK